MSPLKVKTGTNLGGGLLDGKVSLRPRSTLDYRDLPIRSARRFIRQKMKSHNALASGGAFNAVQYSLTQIASGYNLAAHCALPLEIASRNTTLCNRRRARLKAISADAFLGVEAILCNCRGFEAT